MKWYNFSVKIILIYYFTLLISYCWIFICFFHAKSGLSRQIRCYKIFNHFIQRINMRYLLELDQITICLIVNSTINKNYIFFFYSDGKYTKYSIYFCKRFQDHLKLFFYWNTKYTKNVLKIMNFKHKTRWKTHLNVFR